MTRTDADWLSIRDVADRLSVHPQQVRKWLREGQFDTYVVFSPRVTRIARTAYERFIQNISSRVIADKHG